ncbi:MAG: hypothetical protein JKY26_16210 [Pseudomonas sp.]|nr:hypothetical protein [Pseudomonas sp.]
MRATVLAISAGSVLLAGCLGGNSSTDPVDQRAAVRLNQFEVVDRYPAFGGQTFGTVGAYEVINANAHFWLNPDAPANTDVVDLDAAPTNAEGYVEYSTEVVLLRPVDPSQARRVAIYDAPNRGSKVINRLANDGSIDSDLSTAAEAGNGFLMREGYTLIWSGWQADTGNLPAGAINGEFPVASGSNGPITGEVHLETVFNDSNDPGTLRLEYPVVEQDQSRVSISVRQRTNDAPTPIAADQWSFTSDKTISVNRPAGFDAGAIYRVVYDARDPIVAGLGMTATRDLIAFLRYADADAQGNPNPLLDLVNAPCEKDAAGTCLDESAHIETMIGTGVSQSSRYLRDFLWQGFNTTADGQVVFDGMLPFIAGSRKSFTNARFAMPDRFSRQHEEQLVPGNQFPFHYPATTDPVTGEQGGLLEACTADGNCPKIIHMDNSSEFWQAGAGLVATDGDGGDIEQPSNVRLFHIAGAPHIATPAGLNYCAYPGTGMNYRSMTRSLLTELVDWTAARKDAIASQWPRLDQNELALVSDQAAVGFPDLTSVGIEFPGFINPVDVTDYSEKPPVATAAGWQSYVPVTDDDGNELGGVRLPDVDVPLGTYLGWNVRADGFAPGELCFLFGSFVPFAQTEAERVATGDPRPSLEARYASKADYVAQVRASAEALVAQGLLLEEDVGRYVFFADRTTAFD